MNRPPRVAFIFTHQIQYFTPLLQALHDRGILEVAAFYAHQTNKFKDGGFGRFISWDNCQNTTFKSVLLPDSGSRPFGGFFTSFSPALFHELSRFSPDIVHLNGYSNAIQWIGWLWACTHRKRIVARGDGDTFFRSKSRLAPLNKLLARIFTHRLDVVFHQGIENKAFWKERGAEETKLEWIPCVSDNHVFLRSAFESAEQRQAFRSSAGASPEDRVFVVSGKLESRKRPMDAIEALAAVHGEKCKLWFLGSGPLEQDLKERARALGVEEHVHWWGFRNQSELPSVLQAADVLLHPSEMDPWPYSILEGAMSGLPLLLSDRTGSHPDLIGHAGCGLTFRCGDVGHLSQQMKRLLDSPDQLLQFSAAARACTNDHTEQRYCEIVEARLTSLVSSPTPTA